MKALFRLLVLTAALILVRTSSAAVPGEVDRHCWKSPVPDSKEEVCQILAVDRGSVTFIEPGFRSLVIGKYAVAAQRFVPRTEAPIRDVRSPHGWHIVVSSFLSRGEEQSPMLRIRFFGPDGESRGTAEVLMTLEEVKMGYLFGGTDYILAIQSNEEHSYNSMADIWLLPEPGNPRQLIEMNATLGKFSKGDSGSRPGAWIRRQTYDGVHAQTKGWANEFWVWNPAKKLLTLEKK